MDILKKLELIFSRSWVATNQEAHRTSFLLGQMGLKSLFARVFSSSSVGYLKPSRDYLEHIVGALECPPSSILLWDDMMHNVEEARKFGISAELYVDYYEFTKIMKAYFAMLEL